MRIIEDFISSVFPTNEAFTNMIQDSIDRMRSLNRAVETLFIDFEKKDFF